MLKTALNSLLLILVTSVCTADFTAYNDCIRGTGDTTAANVTNWTIYPGYTANTAGPLIDFSTGVQLPVSAAFAWNSTASLAISQTSGSEDGESQPRPGTPAYEVFGGVVDFSNRLIYYGASGWWVEIAFTGLNPTKKYSFATTAIRGATYLDRLTLFTLSGHTQALNNSSDGIYLKNGDQSVLIAGGNHLNTTGYIVRWDDITVADQGDGTGQFKVRAEAYGANYRAYPFGGFMLEEYGNSAPIVDAGSDQTLMLPKEYLTLNGSVTDDGQGEPDGYLLCTWSQVSGPIAAEFIKDIHQPQTTVRFPAAGIYRLRLDATDGQSASWQEVSVTVQEAVCPLGDIDNDCQTTLADLELLALAWLESTAAPADLNGNEFVDMEELGLVAQSWQEDWTGSLKVNLLPVEVIAAGAKWRVNGGPWMFSGQTVNALPEGTHTVEFSSIAQWSSPDVQNISVIRQQTTTLSGQYSIPPRTLEISEFMAVNSNISNLYPAPSVNIYTVIDGQPAYEDWIELRNLTDESVSLEGWYLTDNPDDLTKWRFPAGYSIPAKGYLVVYASNKETEKYGYPFIDDLGRLHTNFELALSGEYLALVQPDGRWIEHEYNEYPKQRGLVSYGVGSDERIGYLTGVTHGSANTGIYEGLVGDTAFSVKRGFFDQPFTVLLTCSTPDAEIRYTTDNSEPSANNGVAYDPANPVSITTTTCLRAAAFKTGYLSSNIDTQTYIFLDDVLLQATNPSTGAQVVPEGYPTKWISNPNQATVTGDYQMDPDVVNSALYAPTIKNDMKAIPSISVVVPIDQLFGTTTGIYINQSQDGTERAGSVEMIDPAGAEVFQADCGVRMQGGASESNGGTTLNRWKCYKLSLRLVFRGVYGGQLDYPLFGEKGAQSYDTFVLDSRPQNSWLHSDEIQRTSGEYVRDQVSSDTQLALGGYACHGRPVHLYLNGLYWGLYWLHERPDDSFAASYMGGTKDDYDVLKHDYGNVLSGSNEDYIAMFALSASAPDAVTAFNNLKQKLDVEDFIDYLIANFYIGNGDWDAKNWYASRNRFDPAGRWRWHMWDGEHIMDDGTSLAPEDVTTKNNSMAPTGLHQKWIANAEYRTLFGDRVHKHFYHNGALTPANFAILFTNLTSQIDRAIVGESARWGDNRENLSPYKVYTRTDWLAECNRLLTSFIPGRRDVVLSQFTGKSPAWYPWVTVPELYINNVILYGGDAAVGANLKLYSGGYTMYYTLDGTDPRLPGGTVNPAATHYTAVVPLTRSVHVKARSRTNLGTWSALAEAVYDVGPVRENLRITELMYHPEDPNLEYIELKNIGVEPLNLNLVQFTAGIRHTFGDVSVAAGGFLLLVKNKALFETAYTALPAGVTVIQWDEGSLDNAGETITVKDALGRTIQSFSYKDSWYPLTDGDGFSLTILDPLNTDLSIWGQKIGWRASSTAGGSPGQEETGLAPGSLIINEVLAHSHNTLPDWIELYNTTAQAISIGGWYLSDSEGDLMKYQIAENTEIDAYSYIVFYEDQHFGSAFALSEEGETLYLTSAENGQLTGYQTSQQFDASATNVSLGRYFKSNGDMDFVAMSQHTPGWDNASPLVGPIVITELQYNPAAGNTGNEYIELYNLSAETVTLQELVDTETAPDVFEQEIVPWAFTEGIDFTFPPGTQIPAGGFIILAKDPAAFTNYYAALLPAGTPVFGPFENDTSLSNGGEKVRLCKPGDQSFGKPRAWIRTDQINYDDESPWPTEPDGQGKSLHRILPSLYGNDPAAWIAEDPAPGLL
jgi:hypothetical protein